MSTKGRDDMTKKNDIADKVNALTASELHTRNDLADIKTRVEAVYADMPHVIGALYDQETSSYVNVPDSFRSVNAKLDALKAGQDALKNGQDVLLEAIRDLRK